MDYETTARDLTAAYIANKKGLPSEKEMEQVAKQLAKFYQATLEALKPSGVGEISQVDRERKPGSPWE